MTTLDNDTARACLTRVFDGWAVTSLRGDSPLAALGLSPQDYVCLSDAVFEVCGIRLVDQDFDLIVTLDDLTAAIADRRLKAQQS